MKTVYVQQLLRVLLEEYDDIDYLLEQMLAGQPSAADSAEIRALLKKLDDRNHSMLNRVRKIA